MNQIHRGAAAIIAIAFMTTAAQAGLRQPAEVTVDLTNMSANGDILTAADSIDPDVFIGCGTRNFDDGAGGVFNLGFCQAEDADGDSVTCFTDNPELVRTIREVNDTSFITFAWTDDGAGNLTCTRIGASTQSFYQPEKSKTK